MPDIEVAQAVVDAWQRRLHASAGEIHAFDRGSGDFGAISRAVHDFVTAAARSTHALRVAASHLEQGVQAVGTGHSHLERLLRTRR